MSATSASICTTNDVTLLTRRRRSSVHADKFAVDKVQACQPADTTKDDFKSMCAQEDACYAVYNGNIINLKNFKHPGDVHVGQAFLKEYNARDITEFFDMAHSMDQKALKVVRALTVGRMADSECLLAPEDKELRSLRRRYRSEGRFEMNWGPIKIYFLLEPYLLISIGWYLRSTGAFGALISFLGFVRLFWWIHDMMHHAVFSDGKISDFLCDWLGYLAFGCFLKNTGRAHSIHHAFTNDLDLDTALVNTAPFQFHPSHANRSPAWFVRIQAYVWFGAVLPLYSLYLCLWEMLQLSAFHRVLVAIRIVPVLMLNDWTIAKYALLLPWATAGFVAFVSSLNHFHMEMDHSAQKSNCSFVQAMASSTQDHVAGPIWDWLTGGVSRHTAHHLFPTLPNWQLTSVADDVEQLLAKHKIPYNLASPWSAVKASAKHIHQQCKDCIQ